jgi:integrase
LNPFFRDSPISKITSFEIERYKKYRVGEGVAPATMNRELAVVSQLLNKAIEWGWIASRSAKIVRFKEGDGRIVYLTKQQCARLLLAAAQDQNENVHAFVMVALHTSMRHSKILAIWRDDIDFEMQVIWIPKAKAGAREQPITTELAGYLAQRIKMLPPGCSWIFPSPASRTGRVHTIRKAFVRSVVRAGLDPDQVTPHILRHTSVTHLVQAGVDLPTVQRISGHKTLAMVARYAHQNGAHIQKATHALRYDASSDGFRRLTAAPCDMHSALSAQSCCKESIRRSRIRSPNHLSKSAPVGSYPAFFEIVHTLLGRELVEEFSYALPKSINGSFDRFLKHRFELGLASSRQPWCRHLQVQHPQKSILVAN